MIYDVIVIGGGPSGLMAAISAAEHDVKTLLVEKGQKLGNKLAISGGGRCNVTNRLPQEEIIKHIPGNGKFMYGPFSVFNNEDIIDFFENLGIGLKEEDHGRMFPISNSAQSVVQTLIDQLHKLGVTIQENSPVETIEYGTNTHKLFMKNGTIIKGRSIIISVGGKSVPNTGSTGDGYPWAEKAGHKVTTLYPTEVPLTSNEPFIKDKRLQGLSLRDVALSVLDHKGRTIVTHQMDMIFTHFGISGPAVLRCSQFVVKALMKGEDEVQLSLDVLPMEHQETIAEKVYQNIEANPRKTVKNTLKGLIPERYLTFLLEESGISLDQTCAHISKAHLMTFISFLKKYVFTVNGSLSIEKAFVTGGGVSIKEIVPRTMASRLKKGLFFCGEILDIHGYTGGYNITSALVTGRLAGMNAAFSALEMANHS